MPLSRCLPVLATVLLVACAPTREVRQAPAPEAVELAGCSPEMGWQTGLVGAGRSIDCEDGNYDEAWRLGSSLRGLRAEIAALEVQIDALGSDAAGAQVRQLRQRQIDVEAILGLARINGWESDR